MSAKTYNIGRESRIFWTAETTFKTAVDHAATDIIPHKSGGSVTYDRPEAEISERKSTVGLKSKIRNGKHVAGFSTGDIYMRPSGTTGTSPCTALAAMLKALFGAQANGHASTTTVSASPAPAVGGCTVESGTNVAIGQFIAFSNTAGTGVSGQVARVTGVSTNAITWEPDLSAAPATSDVVTIGFGWTPASPVQGSDLSGAFFHETSTTIESISGDNVNNGEFKISSNGELLCNFSGDGAGTMSFAGTTTVASAYTAAGVALTVATGDGDKFLLDSSIPLYIVVEAEGANTEECMKVTAKSGDVLTVVGAQKTTGASNHASPAVVRPWSPTVSVVGVPLSGLAGQLKIDGTAFKFLDGSIKMVNGFKQLSNHVGETTSEAFVRDGDNPRKATMSLTARFTKDSLTKFGKAVDEDTFKILVRIGDTAAKRWCWYAPAARISKIPQLPEGDTAEASVQIEFELLETSGNDELYCGMV